MAPVADIRAREDGFTLVELLVAITLSMVVLLATLQSFDLFTSNAAHQTRVTDANDQVRSTMDRVVRDLRGASAIVRAESTDLVYHVPEPAGVRTERLCVSSGQLYGRRTLAATGPSAPTEDCSSGTRLATLKSTASTAFTYDGAASSTTPALVKNVGLTFSLDASGGGRTGGSTLRASAARRSAGTLPLTPPDIREKCNGLGALLSVSADIPGVGPLSITYTDANGVAIGAPVAGGWQIPKEITTVLVNVTDAAGATNTIKKDVECSGT